MVSENTQLFLLQRIAWGVDSILFDETRDNVYDIGIVIEDESDEELINRYNEICDENNLIVTLSDTDVIRTIYESENQGSSVCHIDKITMESLMWYCLEKQTTFVIKKITTVDPR